MHILKKISSARLLLEILFFLLFLSISIFVLSKIIFSDSLIGRSLDFNVPSITNLVPNALKGTFFNWVYTNNGGDRSPFYPTLIPINILLFWPSLLGASAWLIARYQMVLSVFFSLYFFFLLARELIKSYGLKGSNLISIAGAIFFALNNYFFCELIFGSNVMFLTFAFVPLLLYAILKYFENKSPSYFLLALVVLIIISSTLQHLVLAYIMISVLAFAYKDYRFFFKIISLHLLTSLYWLIPLLISSSDVASVELSGNYLQNLTVSSANLVRSIFNAEYFSNRNIYLSTLGKKFLFIWLINAAVIFSAVIFSLFKIRFYKKRHQALILCFSIIFVFSLLLVKGANEPFGGIVKYLYQNFPLINLFRSLQRYLSFYVISASILFTLSMVYFVKLNRKTVYIFLILVVLNAMPWWLTRDLGTAKITAAGKMPSFLGEYKLTKGNFDFYHLNDKSLDFAIMPIPPGFSINFLPTTATKNQLQGGDSGLAYGNKRFYATDLGMSRFKRILDKLELGMYTEKDFFDKNDRLFDLLYIRNFVVRKDVEPINSNNSINFDIKFAEDSALNSQALKKVEQTDYVTIFQRKNFLPKIFTADKTIRSEKDLDQIQEITSSNEYSSRTAIFLLGQNESKLNQISKLPGKIDYTPILEYKKINPTKYRIIVHGAKDKFPLMFSETFHSNWKVYLKKPEQRKDKEKLLAEASDYKLLEGNEDDQAVRDELIDYINRGIITSLGNGKEKEKKHEKFEDNKEVFDHTERYKIGFISKNFQDSIQNDNLGDGTIFDTWFKQPAVPDEAHYVVNGYSNSWAIDPNSICTNNLSCTKNSDGTYDLEIVIEYWPQRFLWAGILFTMSIIFGVGMFSVVKSFKKQ